MQKDGKIKRFFRQATDKPFLKSFNQQFVQKKGSPVQGELSSECETEGLALTFFRKKRKKVTIPPSFSRENATSLYTREA